MINHLKKYKKNKSQKSLCPTTETVATYVRKPTSATSCWSHRPCSLSTSHSPQLSSVRTRSLTSWSYAPHPRTTFSGSRPSQTRTSVSSETNKLTNCTKCVTPAKFQTSDSSKRTKLPTFTHHNRGHITPILIRAKNTTHTLETEIK